MRAPPWAFSLERTPQERVAVAAIKALSRGEASEQQQRVALDFIVHRIAAKDEQTFIDEANGGERASAFLAGRREVALAIEKIVGQPMSVLTAQSDGDET